jgi:hypothetical protein
VLVAQTRPWTPLARRPNSFASAVHHVELSDSGLYDVRLSMRESLYGTLIGLRKN